VKKSLVSPLELVSSEIVGPSSSHTAGVMRIGRKIKESVGWIARAHITLCNSLADTGDAHMTKSALVAGLLGWKDNDPRIPFSFSHAEKANLKTVWAHFRNERLHPNTLFAEVIDDKGKLHSFKGVSIGGGRFNVSPMNGNGKNSRKKSKKRR
jgi:L-serine dehydratase